MIQIMIVDDEVQILKALERTMQGSGYEVTLISDPKQAIDQLNDQEWDLVMADYRMPKINGLEVLKAAKTKAPKAIRILMTGYTDIEVIIQAINEGNIYKYIAKPWDNAQLIEIVQESIQYKLQIDENEALVRSVLHENSEWGNITKSLEYKIMQMSEQGVQALLKTIKAKDDALYLHSLRVAWVAKRFGLFLEFKSGEMQILRLAALFHDIGKIAIKDSILYKEGKLDADEMSSMSHHAVVGAEILKEMDFMQGVAEIVLQHHEKFDGKGYPSGLSGSQIKILAQVLSASDIFVALREERPYKKAFSSDEAMAQLQAESGKSVDALIVERFCKVMKGIEFPVELRALEEI